MLCKITVLFGYNAAVVEVKKGRMLETMFACLCVPSQNVSVHMDLSFMAVKGKNAQVESCMGV